MHTTSPVEVAQSSSELNEALTKLETALLTPVVAGELESWAGVVQDATATLYELLPTFLKSVLQPQYAEIAKNDAEQLPRVEKLVAEDQCVLLAQDAFRTNVNAFVKRAAQIKRDEALANAERGKLEQEGLALILSIKRQRAAADTWLAEASYRDRGTVD